MGSAVTKDIEPQKDLTGKVTIVTGPSIGGIGYYTAKAFVERGSTVILAGRDQQKLDEAEAKIREEFPNKGTIIKQILDVSDLESVQTFAQKFQERGLPLNYLINNAGIMSTPADKKTKQGYEAQMGTNHLGHYYLTKLLIPQLKAGAPSRVVNVASRLHFLANVTTPDKLDQMFKTPEKLYSAMGQYGNSKLANMLHAKELNDLYARDGITAYSLHPGVVTTEISRHTKLRFLFMLGNMFMKSPDQGAATTVYCALSDKALKNAGEYFDNCDVAKPQTKAGSDTMFAHALCEYSDKLIGEFEANQSRNRSEHKQAF